MTLENSLREIDRKLEAMKKDEYGKTLTEKYELVRNGIVSSIDNRFNSLLEQEDYSGVIGLIKDLEDRFKDEEQEIIEPIEKFNQETFNSLRRDGIEYHNIVKMAEEDYGFTDESKLREMAIKYGFVTKDKVEEKKLLGDSKGNIHTSIKNKVNAENGYR